MADFDQLIKDKVEQTEYSYKHSAWKSFAKHAGFKAGLSGLQIAAIVLSAVIVVTGVTLGILFLGHPTTNRDQGTVVRVQDTVEAQQAVSPIQNNQGTVDRVQGTVETQHTASPIQDNKRTVNSVQRTVETQHVAPQPKASAQRPKYGPPVELNVDTITQMEPTDEQLRQGNSRLF